MCIICNVGVEAADPFLAAFAAAGREMRAAEAAILVAAGVAEPDIAKRYKALHKKMVNARKAWNRLEEEREPPCEAAPSFAPGRVPAESWIRSGAKLS